jgi:predicted Holliday junction resolvase-like endonuclease
MVLNLIVILMILSYVISCNFKCKSNDDICIRNCKFSNDIQKRNENEKNYEKEREIKRQNEERLQKIRYEEYLKNENERKRREDYWRKL